jgi:microcystin-dependent protein
MAAPTLLMITSPNFSIHGSVKAWNTISHRSRAGALFEQMGAANAFVNQGNPRPIVLKGPTLLDPIKLAFAISISWIVAVHPCNAAQASGAPPNSASVVTESLIVPDGVRFPKNIARVPDAVTRYIAFDGNITYLFPTYSVVGAEIEVRGQRRVAFSEDGFQPSVLPGNAEAGDNVRVEFILLDYLRIPGMAARFLREGLPESQIGQPAMDFRNGIARIWIAENTTPFAITRFSRLDGPSAVKGVAFKLSETEALQLKEIRASDISVEIEIPYDVTFVTNDIILNVDSLRVAARTVLNSLSTTPKGDEPEFLTSLGVQGGQGSQTTALSGLIRKALLVEAMQRRGTQVSPALIDRLMDRLSLEDLVSGQDLTDSSILTFLMADNVQVTAALSTLRKLTSVVSGKTEMDKERFFETLRNTKRYQDINGNTSFNYGPIGGGIGGGVTQNEEALTRSISSAKDFFSQVTNVQRAVEGNLSTLKGLRLRQLKGQIETNLDSRAVTWGNFTEGQKAHIVKLDVAFTKGFRSRDELRTMQEEIRRLIRGASLDAAPIGAIQAYSAEAPPLGWLVCNGAAVPKSTYPDLFNVIGDKFGDSRQLDTFTVPDLRGMFLRGLDLGAGRDPDGAGRTIGSAQRDELKTHTHVSPMREHGDLSSQFDTSTLSGRSMWPAQTGLTRFLNNGYSGGAETRPKNVAVNFIIKAKLTLPTGIDLDDLR